MLFLNTRSFNLLVLSVIVFTCNCSYNSNMCLHLEHKTEIGLGLTGFGIFFSFLGVIFFFDKGLLALGNVSCVMIIDKFLA